MRKQEDRALLILGRNIAERRRALGYHNAEGFAEAAEISISGLRDIERGVSEGRIETRQAIANRLNCSVSELYHDKDSAPKAQDLRSSALLLSTFADLSPDLQKVVLALIYKDSSIAKDIPSPARHKFEALLKAL